MGECAVSDEVNPVAQFVIGETFERFEKLEVKQNSIKETIWLNCAGEDRDQYAGLYTIVMGK